MPCVSGECGRAFIAHPSSHIHVERRPGGDGAEMRQERRAANCPYVTQQASAVVGSISDNGTEDEGGAMPHGAVEEERTMMRRGMLAAEQYLREEEDGGEGVDG